MIITIETVNAMANSREIRTKIVCRLRICIYKLLLNRLYLSLF